MEQKKFNVLVIVPYRFLPPVSGGEICSYGFMQSYAHLSNMSLLSPLPKPSSFEYEEKIETLFHLKEGKFKYLRFWQVFKIARLVRQKNIDFIIMEQPWFGLYVWMVSIFTGVPYVLRCNNIEFQRFRSMGKSWWKLLYYYEKFVQRKAQVVSYLTEEDKLEAIKHFKLDANKALYAPYGFDKQKLNNTGELSKNELGLNPNKKTLLFFGKLSYQPNTEAVEYIAKNINPILNKELTDYEIVICGKGLPRSIENIVKDLPNINYKGFVEDISAYINVADVILNPIISGGGVKTKVIDALAMNKTVVSLFSGAVGVDRSVTGNKLLVAADDNWIEFCKLVSKALIQSEDIPSAFFEEYDYDKVAVKSQQFFEKMMG